MNDNKQRDFFFSQEQKDLRLILEPNHPLYFFKNKEYTECAKVGVYPDKKNNWSDCVYLGQGTVYDITQTKGN